MKSIKLFLTLSFALLLLPSIGVGPEDKTRPSLLSEFTVYGKDSHVKITWATHEREKIENYEIQRSKDGKNFEVLRIVGDAGDAPETAVYFEIDNEPYPGWSYYRIREILKNGDEAFSGVAPVFFGLDRIKKGEIIAAKNPLEEITRAKLSDFHDEQVLLVVRDAEGTEYYVNRKLRVKGERLSIDAGNDIPQGIYVITAASKDELVGLEINADY